MHNPNIVTGYGYEDKEKKYSDSYGYEDKEKKSSDSYGYEDKEKKYSDSYGYEDKEKKYSDSYGYEDKEKKSSDSYGYEKKDKKKDPKLLIKKGLSQCLNPVRTEPRAPPAFEFCEGELVQDNTQFVNCKDREDICLDSIRASDFQIDVIPAVQGSKHPINFDIDQTKFKVDEQFRLNDIGDILCFLANEVIPGLTHFNDGGLYETADERHFAVCADYVGDCDVNEDDFFGKDDFSKEMAYKDYDNGYNKDDYNVPQKCTVNNYVFAELDLDDNLIVLTQLTENLQNRATQS